MEGYLVTFGIKPIRPETGYGYIKPNDKALLGKRGKLRGYRVQKFVEKPNADEGRPVPQGRCTIFGTAACLSGVPRRFWRRFAGHQPAIATAMDRIRELKVTGASTQVIDDVYRAIKPVSIDNGVMEQSSKAAVVPVMFKWSDVGSWGSLDEVAEKNKAGNVVIGRVVDLESTRSIVYADRRVVATIGLQDMVVVDTPDATLVCPKVAGAGCEEDRRYSEAAASP